MFQYVKFEIIFAVCSLFAFGSKFAAVEETVRPQMGEQLSEITKGDEFVVCLLAEFASVWLFSMKLHVSVEIGSCLMAQLANLAQIVAPPKLILGHCFLDGFLLKPTWVQVQMNGQVLLESVSIFETTVTNVAPEGGHSLHNWQNEIGGNNMLAGLCLKGQIGPTFPLDEGRLFPLHQKVQLRGGTSERPVGQRGSHQSPFVILARMIHIPLLCPHLTTRHSSRQLLLAPQVEGARENLCMLSIEAGGLQLSGRPRARK